MVDAVRRALNGHAKLVYVVVTVLAALGAFATLLKAGVDEWFKRVTDAGVLVPQHEEWIEDHEEWSKQRNEYFTESLSDLTRDSAVLKTQIDDNKELSEVGFEQVIGLLTRMNERMVIIDNRMFEIQGRMRADMQPIGDDKSVGAIP